MSGLSANLASATGALLAVLALIWLSGRAVRMVRARQPGGPTGRRLDIRAAVALDPRRRLVLVACDNREVLLLTGGNQDLLVGWLPLGPSGGPADSKYAGAPGMRLYPGDPA